MKQTKRGSFKYIPDQFDRPPETDDASFQKIPKKRNRWKKSKKRRR